MSQTEHYHAVRTERTAPTEENGFQFSEERTVLGAKPTPELAQQLADEDAGQFADRDTYGVTYEVTGPCDCDPETAAREQEENAVRDAEANEPVLEGELVDADDDQS